MRQIPFGPPVVPSLVTANDSLMNIRSVTVVAPKFQQRHHLQKEEGQGRRRQPPAVGSAPDAEQRVAGA